MGVDGPMSMAQLLAQTRSETSAEMSSGIPFPSLANLYESCAAIPQTRDMTSGLEEAFLSVKDALKVILDPLTQPLSWALDGALWAFLAVPWWVLLPSLFWLTWYVSRSVAITIFVAFSFLFLGIIDLCRVFDLAMRMPMGTPKSTQRPVQTKMIDNV